MAYVEVGVDRHQHGRGHLPAAHTRNPGLGEGEGGIACHRHRTLRDGVGEPQRLQVDVPDIAVEMPSEGVPREVSGGLDGEGGGPVGRGGRNGGVAASHGHVGGDVLIGHAVVADMGEVDLRVKVCGRAEGVEPLAVERHTGGEVADPEPGHYRLYGELARVKVEDVAFDPVVPLPGEGHRTVGGGGNEVGGNVAPVEVDTSAQRHRRQVDLTGQPGIHQCWL